MQYRTPFCQPDQPASGDLRPFSSADEVAPTPVIEQGCEYSAGQVPVVRGAAQHIEHTASRRTGPRRWLRAVEWWAVAAGLHPRTRTTVLRIAADIASRMDYDTGHARYCLDDIASRLGIDRATVKRHIARLREAGLLAWVTKGSRTNIRRALGLEGYAGTATVYAAVIPPVYDQVHGNVIVGAGYEARLLTDGAHLPVDNSPVDNPDAPPSRYVVKEEGELKVDGGYNYTSRKRASRSTAAAPSGEKRSSRGGGPRRSPLQVARDCQIAAKVRPLVGWTQGEGIRRLAFALRPLIDQGLDAHDIVTELTSWYLAWRPSKPAAYIRVKLAKAQAYDAALAAAARPMDNAGWAEWLDRRNRRREQEAREQEVLAAMAAADGRAEEERQLDIQHAWANPLLVLDHLDEHGPDETLAYYGPRLTAVAERLAASGARFTCRW